MLSLLSLQDAALLRHYHGCPGRTDLAYLLPRNISGSVGLTYAWLDGRHQSHVQHQELRCMCTERFNQDKGKEIASSWTRRYVMNIEYRS